MGARLMEINRHLVVRVPSGATEIDLRPVVMPIVQAILAQLGKDSTEHGATEFVTAAMKTAEFHRRVLDLRASVVASWLKQTGWEYSHTNVSYHHEPQDVFLKRDDRGWDTFARVFVPHDNDSPSLRLRMLCTLLRNGRSPCWAAPREVLACIELHATVIDKMASLDTSC